MEEQSETLVPRKNLPLHLVQSLSQVGRGIIRWISSGALL